MTNFSEINFSVVSSINRKNPTVTITNATAQNILEELISNISYVDTSVFFSYFSDRFNRPSLRYFNP